jgi:hypothetical protein
MSAQAAANAATTPSAQKKEKNANAAAAATTPQEPKNANAEEQQCFIVKNENGGVLVTPVKDKNTPKGGSPTPTTQRVMLGGRNAVVYKGTRGGKYVKKGGEFFALSKLKL